MSEIIEFPATIPPTSHFNFFKHWWQRSEKTASIAEARVIQRSHNALPDAPSDIPTFARIARISIDKEDGFSSRYAKQINTLYISQQPNQATPFQFNPHPQNLLEEIHKENSDNQRNLVICHGYGAGLGFFYRNFQSLSQEPGWRLFAIDWLGMGNSSRPKWDFAKKAGQTWDDIVADVESHFVETLEDWRSKVGLEKMTLFGHSLGGYFATCYALKYPQRVEKLILVSPAGIAENPNLKEQQEELKKDPQEAIAKEAQEIGETMQANVEQEAKPASGPRRNIPGWAVYLWDRNVTPMSIVRMIGPFGASLVHRYTSRRFAHLKEDEQHDLYDYLYNITSSSGSGEYALAAVLSPGAFARKPLFHKLAGLQMPTVFVYGENDWMDYKAAEKAKQFMKVPVKVIRIAEGGHHMYLENPQDFNKAIREEMQ